MSSTDVKINFAFSYLHQKILDADLIAFRDSSRNALKKIYPQNTYMELGLGYYGPKDNKLFSWFEYYGPTLDEDVYSFNAYMREDGSLLCFLFNCPKEIYKNWRGIVFETIKTIRSKPVDWIQREED